CPARSVDVSGGAGRSTRAVCLGGHCEGRGPPRRGARARCAPGRRDPAHFAFPKTDAAGVAEQAFFPQAWPGRLLRPAAGGNETQKPEAITTHQALCKTPTYGSRSWRPPSALPSWSVAPPPLRAGRERSPEPRLENCLTAHRWKFLRSRTLTGSRRASS